MGLFYAPHTVGEALKSAVYIAALYQSFGYDVTPKWDEPRQDIVQCLGLENPDSLVAFCQGVQSGRRSAIPFRQDLCGTGSPANAKQRTLKA